MAKGRIRSRMELREQYDAAEARERDERKTRDDEDGDDDAGPATAEADEGDEAAPVKKKPKKAATAKESKPRKKPVKQIRRRVVWIVYDNSNKKVAQYDYTKKTEADEHAARLMTEKKVTHFVQPFKEEISD